MVPTGIETKTDNEVETARARHLALLVNEPKDAAITKALLAMAHRLDLNVVAEGVENEAQFSFLGENECDEVQGYLFGRPIPTYELFRVLTSR